MHLQSTCVDLGAQIMDHTPYYPQVTRRVTCDGRTLARVTYEIAVIARAAAGLPIPLEGCPQAQSILDGLRRDGLDVRRVAVAIRNAGIVPAPLAVMTDDLLADSPRLRRVAEIIFIEPRDRWREAESTPRSPASIRALSSCESRHAHAGTARGVADHP